MRVTSLLAAVAPRTGIVIKNGLRVMASVFLKEEKICYKMVYYTLHLSQSSEIVLQSYFKGRKCLQKKVLRFG